MHEKQENQIKQFPDRSIRRLLQDKEYLRWLVRLVAPELERFLDFNQIRYQKRSFISEALRERESDILLRIPFQDNTDELIIYILIEHQSTVDKTMGFRLLSYMVQIWEAQRQGWETENLPASKRRLQPILPILFYTGKDPWNAPVSLTAIMDVPEMLERFVPSFDTLFLGVKQTAAEALTEQAHPLGWLLRVLQKEDTKGIEEISEVLSAAMSYMASVDEAFALQVREALRYFLQLIYHRRSHNERDALVDIIKQHTQDPKELEAMAQTTAEFLIEQGKAQGIEQGIEQGKAEGIEQGKAEGIEQGKAEGIEQGKAEGIEQGETRAKRDALLKLLRHQFQNVPETLVTQIQALQDPEQLDAIFEKSLNAKKLEDLDIQ